MGRTISDELLKVDGASGDSFIYPRAIIQKLVDEAAPAIRDGTYLGMIEMCREGKIMLSRVSHTVTKLALEGDSLMATIKVLPTPQGRVLDRMIRRGRAKVRLSLEAWGTSKKGPEGKQIVTEYKFLQVMAFDALKEEGGVVAK